MGVNWPAGLHHPDGPGRRRALPVSARRKLVVAVGGSSEVAPNRRHHRPDPGKVDHTVQAPVKEG